MGQMAARKYWRQYESGQSNIDWITIQTYTKPMERVRRAVASRLRQHG